MSTFKYFLVDIIIHLPKIVNYYFYYGLQLEEIKLLPKQRNGLKSPQLQAFQPVSDIFSDDCCYEEGSVKRSSDKFKLRAYP